MHDIVELSSSLKKIFECLGLTDEDFLKVFSMGLKDLLMECEKEILEFEIKYNMSFETFKADLESGNIGDPFSYPLEKDAMIWEDLMKEKQMRLESFNRFERLCYAG